VGFQPIRPGSPYPPKGHPSRYWFNPASGRRLHEHQIIYVTAGSGTFRSDSIKQRKVAAGNVILLFPGEWHSYRPDPGGWDTYWIGFYGHFPDQLVGHQFFSRAEAILDIGFHEEIAGLFDRAIELARQERAGFQQILSGIVIHLLGIIYYVVKNNLFEDKEIVLKIEEARMLMREHPGGELCVKDIASSLHMSYSWFRKMFRQYTGLSPAQYQLQVKVQKAKDLLVSSPMSIKEIAYLLQFESSSYFVSFFKNKTGMTPLSFRKMSRGQL
jgi:AraC-like DNA-binding protein